MSAPAGRIIYAVLGLIIIAIILSGISIYYASVAASAVSEVAKEIRALRSEVAGLPTKVAEAVKGVVPPPKPAPPVAPPKPKVTLTIEYGEPWKMWVDMAISKFKEKYPEVEIKPLMIPYGVDFCAKITLDLKAGTAGDIVIYDSFMTAEYATAGLLLDLTDFVKAWPDWDKFPEPMKKIVSFKGRVYGVMIDTDVRMIWYRKDIFKLAGLPEEWQPKTWDDIIKAALALKKAEDKIMRTLGIKEFFPIYIPAGTRWGEATTMQGFYMLLLGADAPPYNRLYDYRTGKWIGASPAIYYAFKFYYDIYVKHKVAPIEYNFARDVWGTHRKVFAKGNIAMELGGSWEWEEGWGPKGVAPIPDREKKVGFAKMPGRTGGAAGEPKWVTISGGWAIGINAKIAKEKIKYAWEFIKILCSKEILAKCCAAYGKVCPRIDAAEVPEYAKNPYLVKILEYVKFTDYRDALPGYSKVSFFVQKVTEEIITKGITPEEAVKKFYKLMVDEFGKDKVEVVKPEELAKLGVKLE